MPHASGAPVVLGDTPLTLDAIAAVARHRAPVTIGSSARERMTRARQVIDRLAAGGAEAPAVYGVNTGFGALAEKRISHDQIKALQQNLVRSHACGVSTPLPTDAVRAMMLLRAAVLAVGHSGARVVCCQLLCDMLDRGVHPIIPSRGSVGASGDLAPLAHLALVLIGEGEAEHDGQRLPGGEALRRAGLQPIELEAKEGLTLLNGTQLMTAVGALAVLDAEESCRVADIAGAMSLEAYKGTPRAFDPRIHAARPHPGQIASARALAMLLADSEIVESHRDCGKVQDPYSFRCMPQVHGATRDTLAHARAVLEREAASATDNPLVFERGGPGSGFAGPGGAEGHEAPLNENEIVSGGNFHGQPVALALDFACIAIAELANISERRVEQLVNPHLSSGLPPFLAPDSGLHSGFMMAQVTAAALVSENKILSHPASVDSIPSSAGREDHVSMGAHASLKLAQVLDHVRTVLAVEILVAAQGLDLRAPFRPGPYLRAGHAFLRERVPVMIRDRPIAPDIAAVRRTIDDGSLVRAVWGGPAPC
jgi:histidine ammonia-lyase